MQKFNKIMFFSRKLLLVVGLALGLGILFPQQLPAVIGIKSIRNIASILREDKRHLSPLSGLLFLNLKYLDFIEASKDPALKPIQDFINILFYRHHNGEFLPSVSDRNVFHVINKEIQRHALNMHDDGSNSLILEEPESVKSLESIEKKILPAEKLIGELICELERAYEPSYVLNLELISVNMRAISKSDSFKKGCKAFIKALTQAFACERSLQQNCLPHLVQYILLSYLWSYSDTREDLLEYFKPFPEEYFTDSAKDAALREFLNQTPYTKNEASAIASPRSLEESVIKVWKKMLFHVPFPPVVQFKRILYKHNRLGVDVEYTNCVEVCLQNIFNAALYDVETQAVSIDALKSIAHGEALEFIQAYEENEDLEMLVINQDDLPSIKFVKFYLNPKSMRAPQSQDVALEWAKVTQNSSIKRMPNKLVEHLKFKYSGADDKDIGTNIYFRPNGSAGDMWVDYSTNKKLNIRQIKERIQNPLIIADDVEHLKFYEMDAYADTEFFGFIMSIFVNVKSIEDMFHKVNDVYLSKNLSGNCINIFEEKIFTRSGKRYMSMKISKGLIDDGNSSIENQNLHLWEWAVSRDHSEIQPCYSEVCDQIKLSSGALDDLKKDFEASNIWFQGVLSGQNILGDLESALKYSAYFIPTFVMRSSFGDAERLNNINRVAVLLKSEDFLNRVSARQLIELCNNTLNQMSDAGNEHINADDAKKNYYLKALARLCCSELFFCDQRENIKNRLCSIRTFFDVMVVFCHVIDYDRDEDTEYAGILFDYLLGQRDFVTQLGILIPEDEQGKAELLNKVCKHFDKQRRQFRFIFSKMKTIATNDEEQDMIIHNFAQELHDCFRR